MESFDEIVQRDDFPILFDTHWNLHFTDLATLLIFHFDIPIGFIGDLGHFMSDPLFKTLHMNIFDGSLTIARGN